MPEGHINKLAKIDDRLRLLNEERLTLQNERQALIKQQEAELAKKILICTPP